jgi:hypothetical protein
MINLEVWSQAGFNMEPWIKNELVIDAGPLGPTGRFGWFMPTEFVEGTWYTSKHVIDHWRALTTDDITSHFSLSNRLELIRRSLARGSATDNTTYCDHL